jgi:predicted transcriptional regulator
MTRSEKAVARIYGKAAEHRIRMTNLADAAGVSRVTLSNWRTGRSTPMLEQFLSVEAALDEIIADKIGVG